MDSRGQLANLLLRLSSVRYHLDMHPHSMLLP